MILQIVTVRLKDGSTGKLVYLVEGDRIILRPDHLGWGRTSFSLHDVVEQLGVTIVEDNA